MASPGSTNSIERPTRVFISYSRKDGAFAEALRDALIARSFEAYLDKHDIAPGEPWRDVVFIKIGLARTALWSARHR
jgi:TIR domain